LKAVAKQTTSLPASVIIIDDDSLLRRSIARLLQEHTHNVEAYESLAQLYETGKVPRIGCALLDLNLPGANGLEIQAKLAVVAPTLSIVFLTGFGQVDSSVRAMKGGAVDFLQKPVEDVVLLQAVERAIERSRALGHQLIARDELRQRFERLSTREREVFALVTSGLLNKQAAAELGIAEKTVKFHRAHIMEKMEVESLAELAKMADRINLTKQL
jgi:FixJ family two-component response regulator